MRTTVPQFGPVFTPNKIDGRRIIVTHEGYAIVRYSSHPNATRNGYVGRARLVMENKIGRYLRRHEQVWHVDRNRSNDAPENLTLRCPRRLPERACPACGKTFRPLNRRIRYCSIKCGHAGHHRCRHPSAELLRWLVWNRPTENVGEYFGVSGKAVEKWCKRLGVKKPGRGYWAKVQAGKVRHENPYSKPSR